MYDNQLANLCPRLEIEVGKEGRETGLQQQKLFHIFPIANPLKLKHCGFCYYLLRKSQNQTKSLRNLIDFLKCSDALSVNKKHYTNYCRRLESCRFV